MHTTFDSITSDSLARLRNEIIKQARVHNVYDQLSSDVMIHMIIDIIRIRVEHAKVMGEVFVDSKWQHGLLKAHSISKGLFGNNGLNLADYIRQWLHLTGKPQYFQLPSFQ